MGSIHAIPPGARLKVLTVSAKVLVRAEDRADVEIEPERRIEIDEEAGVMQIRTRSTDLEIFVPEGMNVSVGTVSGDVTMEGCFGTVKAATVSGHVRIGDTEGDADVRSISGHIEVGDCGGRCRANTKSGSIEIDRVASKVLAHTMSGKIEVGTAGLDDVELKTISGKLTVRVDPGRSPRTRLRSLSGKVKSDCPEGGDFEIKASTISGNIEVQER